MTQEEKQLLLKDLCARLPYRVICDMWFEGNEPDKITEVLKCGGLMRLMNSEFNFMVKPYLRPMSSMTEEEMKVFQAFHCVDGWHPYFYQQMCNLPNLENMFNWLNKHHFDYRGLIPMGLALEAPENMYKNN